MTLLYTLALVPCCICFFPYS